MILRYVVELKDGKFLGKYNGYTSPLVDKLYHAEIFPSHATAKDFISHLSMPKFYKIRKIIIDYNLID